TASRCSTVSRKCQPHFGQTLRLRSTSLRKAISLQPGHLSQMSSATGAAAVVDNSVVRVGIGPGLSPIKGWANVGKGTGFFAALRMTKTGALPYCYFRP